MIYVWGEYPALLGRHAAAGPRRRRHGYNMHRSRGVEVWAGSPELADMATAPFLKPDGHCAPFWNKTSDEMTTVAREIRWESSFARFEMHQVRMKDGSLREWAWFEEPEQVNVAVQMEDTGRVAIFKQSKYGLPGISLAPVGGGVDHGESALDAAKRETQEEMHLECSRWTYLGRYRVDTNRGLGFTNQFLSQGCVHLENSLDNPYDLESQSVTTISVAELRLQVELGAFQEIKWIATMSMALPILEDAAQSSGYFIRKTQPKIY